MSHYLTLTWVHLLELKSFDVLSCHAFNVLGELKVNV